MKKLPISIVYRETLKTPLRQKGFQRAFYSKYIVLKLAHVLAFSVLLSVILNDLEGQSTDENILMNHCDATRTIMSRFNPLGLFSHQENTLYKTFAWVVMLSIKKNVELKNN